MTKMSEAYYRTGMAPVIPVWVPGFACVPGCTRMYTCLTRIRAAWVGAGEAICRHRLAVLMASDKQD